MNVSLSFLFTGATYGRVSALTSLRFHGSAIEIELSVNYFYFRHCKPVSGDSVPKRKTIEGSLDITEPGVLDEGDVGDQGAHTCDVNVLNPEDGYSERCLVQLEGCRARHGVS